jgi:Flp pilus assembly protein TadD
MESKRLNAEGLHMLSGANPDLASARSDFERAFQLDSTSAEALNNLGYVYGRLGDYHTAESTLLKVLGMSPTRKAAQGNLGAVQAELGKTQEAADHFCQYIRQFDSIEQGKSTVTRVFKDSDQNVQAAINLTLANCN